MALLERFQRIVIEGPIGVGKTSLAKALAHFPNAQLVLEEAGQNPFLNRFYEMPGSGYALPVQLHFMIQRMDQQPLYQEYAARNQRVVSDYLFEKNDVFAHLTLNKDEWGLYQRISQAMLSAPAVPPDLVLWLQAEPQTLLNRIRQRGIASERRIDEGYLQRLCAGYAQLFQSYELAPVFAVNTERFHPVENQADFQVLIDRIDLFRGTREFFNPQL